jgi:hypothetical protein
MKKLTMPANTAPLLTKDPYHFEVRSTCLLELASTFVGPCKLRQAVARKESRCPLKGVGERA